MAPPILEALPASQGITKSRDNTWDLFHNELPLACIVSERGSVMRKEGERGGERREREKQKEKDLCNW